MWKKGMSSHVDKVIRSVDTSGSAVACFGSDHTLTHSWERCLTRYNLDPSTANKPRILTGRALREYQEPLEEFLLIAKSGIKSLYEKVAPSGYVILLGDQNGVTIDYLGDPKDERENRESGLYLGSLWSESIEGTCGVGTCIEDRRAITIHRDEHFRARHIGLSCSTAPLFLPDGSLLGTLDASLLRPPAEKTSQLLILQIVNHYARLIENAYFLRLHRESWIVRFNTMQAFVEVATESMVAVSPEGQVIAANDSAMKALGARDGFSPIDRNVSEVFDLSFDVLMHHALHRTTTILPIRAVRAGAQYFATFRAPEAATGRLGKKGTAEKGLSARPAPSCRLTLDYLAGTDPRMMHNASVAKRVVNKDISILLIGETGTGKEVFAHAVHDASDRASRPFVALNCASIPESLIESELFGYKQGAFTGANSKGMRGKILQSDGGTLFLDEIGDMPLNLQTRLLRVLAEKEVLPLGSETPMRVDLHVICATLRKLEDLVRDGQFREDLYYRLNGVTITLPALRDRQDKALLIENVLASEAGNESPMRMAPEAFEVLLDYHWPGNVRQLRNVMRYSIAINESGVIGLQDLPCDVIQASTREGVFASPKLVGTVVEERDAAPSGQFEDSEHQEVFTVLKKHRWNITDASRELGMSRSTLYRKMRKYSIVSPNDLVE